MIITEFYWNWITKIFDFILISFSLNSWRRIRGWGWTFLNLKYRKDWNSFYKDSAELSSRGFIIKDHVGVFLMKYSHSKAKNHAGKRELVGGDIRVITLKYCVHVNYSRALTIKRSSIAEIFRSSVSQTLFSPTSSWKS